MAKHSMTLIGLTLVGAACSSSDSLPPSEPPSVEPQYNLHVPSPNWEEQVIYFVMTDRFANGDPTNDDQGAGEFDPSDFRKYSGGDLQGIIDNLDYIQGLGATAIWITPPVANQWWDPLVEFGGYHGYWARDPKAVDEHVGDLDTYRRLSSALHDRGMYLIQDIVPNHMGNFFSYSGPYDPSDPSVNLIQNPATVPTTAPTLPPFDQFDYTNPAHREAGIYHFTPAINDFQDPFQETNYQLSDLDDLNTENPVVRDALRDVYGYWIDAVGIDGVRIDTVKFIEVPFWNDFLYSNDETAPGLEVVARQTGRDDFLTFGEVFDLSEPFEDAGEQKMARYLDTPDGPALDGLLQFPLFGSIQRVLTEGQPTAQLGYRIEKMLDTSLFPNPRLNPTFIDNHDVQRFLTRGSENALRQALMLLMTLPGIPVIFQGTEQGFDVTRASLFAEGWGSGGQDRLDTSASLYEYIQGLAEIRRNNPVFVRGELEVLRTNVARAGPFAFARTLDGETAIVILNTASGQVLVDLETGLPAGTALTVLQGPADLNDVVVGEDGRLLFEMDEEMAWILRTTGESRTPPATDVSVVLDTDISAPLTADTRVSGRLQGTSELRLVIDDDLLRSQRLTVAADGTWSSTISLDAFPYGTSEHTVEVYAPAGPATSGRRTFTVNRTFDGTIIDIEDPRGDDTGPTGNYVYPTDETFTRQMDIIGLRAEVGSQLTLRFEMADLTRVWSPPRRFDHVSFTIFFDLPGSDGVAVLPQLDATAPDGFLWDRTHFAYGWSNEMRSSEGADATATGTPVNPAPSIVTDVPTRIIAFTYDLEAFGISSWDGVQVYVTTWDYDGIDARYRTLNEGPSQWNMGGSDGGPKIMDDLGPFTLTQ